MSVYLGIDIGSTTTKVVVLNEQRSILGYRYLRSRGQPRKALLQVIEQLSVETDLSSIAGVGLTGSGGEAIAQLIGGRHVNELVAQTEAVGTFHPEARTIIEMGGQDSKFLSVIWNPATAKMVLVDFSMNPVCAAGTGSFLDQQAERLGIAIEGEFADLALQSENPARIAGRCTVFAKSDMIHLQQKGTPLPDILAGLCLALARNFKTVIGKGKAFTPPVLFQGGVAYNRAVVWAFEQVLGLQPGQLTVPQHHTIMAALGTGFIAMEDARQGQLPAFLGFEPLADYERSGRGARKAMLPLAPFDLPPNSGEIVTSGKRAPVPAYVGIDVGSISTNVVVIDESSRVLARRYLMTAGAPLAAVQEGLAQVGQEIGDAIVVNGVGVTGSGRYLTGDFVGADVVRNEITAQARAAVEIDPTVDTVFEIGGQDSKFISLNHGAVVDFAMNSACAAGTGSFLEEQAERLQIDIKDDFGRLALATETPTCLGERCTVFMESDLVHHQQQGASIDELTGGLAYAIAQNYLNRVVNGRRLGRNIFFQGGVAWNRAVVAAFRSLTNRSITVPPHHDVTGAIGAGILAKEAREDQRRNGQDLPSKFRGFDLRNRSYESTIFECQACPNLCEISKVVIENEPPFFYGARCDRFEEAGRVVTVGGHERVIPDLFAERNALLIGDYVEPGARRGRPRVAIPRALLFYDLFPYWRTLFSYLDVDVLLSSPTNPRAAGRAAERASVETCFPAKLLFAHVAELQESDADFILLPSVANREIVVPGQMESNSCTFIPAMPHLVTAQMDFSPEGPQPLKFTFHMQWPSVRRKELRQLARTLGISASQMDRADALALEALHAFNARVRARGQEILSGLEERQKSAVIVGRTYNTCDVGACQDLPYKLRKMDVLPIPIDYLSLGESTLAGEYSDMFWRSGQAILSAARIVSNDPRLQAIYVTNFNCGPDSFLLSFFQRTLGTKPFLELEFDDHTADAGVITRCEAFFESLAMGHGRAA